MNLLHVEFIQGVVLVAVAVILVAEAACILCLTGAALFDLRDRRQARREMREMAWFLSASSDRSGVKSPATDG